MRVDGPLRAARALAVQTRGAEAARTLSSFLSRVLMPSSHEVRSAIAFWISDALFFTLRCSASGSIARASGFRTREANDSASTPLR